MAHILKAIIKVLTSLQLTVIILCFSVVVVFLGTVAQEPMGLNLAVKKFFQSTFVDWVSMKAALGKCMQMFFGWQLDPIPQERLIGSSFPCFPGGYFLGGLLLVNLLAAYYSRFVFSWKKAGILLTHFGIIMLLVGQVLTDQLAIESYVAMEAGDRRNYSESHDINELVVITKQDDNSSQVVSIPEWMLEKKRKISHTKLDGVTIQATRYWRNAHLANKLEDTISHMLEEYPSGSAQYQKAKKSADTFLAFLKEAKVPDDLEAWNDFVGKLSRMDKEVEVPKEFMEQMRPFLSSVRTFLKKIHPFQRDPNPDTPVDLWVIAHEVDFGMDARNQPVVQLEIFQPKQDKENQKRRMLVSPLLREQTLTLDKDDTDSVAQVSLRGKRYYHPYSLTLVDLKWEWYPGTETPRNYESIVRITPASGEDYVSSVYMNHPLRLDGKTHYQHQLGKQATQAKGLFTQLAVVQNPSWLTPYFGCLVVAAGMLWQFLSHLIGFAQKRNRE